jgi:ribonuclease H-related protein
VAKFKFEDKLRGKGQQLAAALAGHDLEAAVREDSFRDYSCKLGVKRAGKYAGNINLYYSPTRDEYTCKLHQITEPDVATEIESVWNELAGTTAAEVAPLPMPAKGHQVYVDGSYINGRVGYGAVLLNDGVEIKRFSGGVFEDLETRQVAGELMATMTVLDWCEANDIAKIEILYDYEGIEKWARGLWKANKPLTQRYVMFMSGCPVKIKWQKVRSHTGNKWNDVADELAKQGASQRS